MALRAQRRGAYEATIVDFSASLECVRSHDTVRYFTSFNTRQSSYCPLDYLASFWMSVTKDSEGYEGVLFKLRNHTNYDFCQTQMSFEELTRAILYT